MKKYGFTLAEVLIVLVILGVIASMTVPSLMNNSNQQVYLTGLQKAYSSLNNAITLAAVDNGITPADNNISAQVLAEDLFGETLKVSRTNAAGYFQTQDGMWFVVDNAQGGCGDIPANPADVAVVGGNAGACAQITVDVNGTKGPNQLTTSVQSGQLHDQYMFYVYQNGVTGGDPAQDVTAYLLTNGVYKGDNAAQDGAGAATNRGNQITYANGIPQGANQGN